MSKSREAQINNREGSPTVVFPCQLRCEYLKDPMGLNMFNPRFYWSVKSSSRGVYQAGYRILVATKRATLDQDKGDMWDSGYISSDQQLHVLYDGHPLQGCTTYYWKVLVWDQEGVYSPWSEVARFHMGMLKQNDWTACWITCPQEEISAPLFRREWLCYEPVVEATAYVSGLGYYELYLNDRKVSDHVLDPGTTEYDKRALYQVYDVTGYVHSGLNAVGVMLGNGWFRHRSMKAYGSTLQLLCELQLRYADGTTEVISTDTDWACSSGPIVENSIWDGEVYDARRESSGWCKPGFDDTQWYDAERVHVPGRELDAQLCPPVRVVETLRPVGVFEPQEGTFVFDFGQVITGWPRLHVTGEAGTQVTLYTSEVTRQEMARLREEPSEPPLSLIDTTENRTAAARDIYVLKGNSHPEIYEPRFTYHGFRYVQVEGYPGRPAMTDIEACWVHSDVEETGTFSCSHSLFNHIHENIRCGQKANLFSMPTDCPQRDERQGWTGDGHLTAEEAIYNFDMAAFYTKWLRDIKDAQASDGSIPDTVPYHGFGGAVATPAWQVAYPLTLWYMYVYYGDVALIREHWEPLTKWFAYMASIAREDVIESGRGDWVPPKKGRPEDESAFLTSTGYFYYSARLLAEMAQLIDHEEDALYYQKRAGEIADAFNKRFLDTDNGQYLDGSQTNNAFALAIGVVPNDRKNAVLNNLLRTIEEDAGGNIWAGILGTKALVYALPAFGHRDVLYRMAEKTTFPSWGYMISKGATTLWERWGAYKFFDAGMNSLNHIMFGTIDEFFYRELAGISPDEPGYKSVRVQPWVPEGMAHAGADLKTLRGTVSCWWQKEGEALYLNIVIPPNTSGKLLFPNICGEQASIREDGRLLWDGNRTTAVLAGISQVQWVEGRLCVDLAAGDYEFFMRPA